MASNSYFDQLRQASPELKDYTDLDLIRSLYPDTAIASDGSSPVSDQTLVRRIMSAGGIPPEEFDQFSQYLGMQKPGFFDEIGSSFSDSLDEFDNLATNATPALVGRAVEDAAPEMSKFLGIGEWATKNQEEYNKQSELLAETSNSQAPGSFEDISTVGDMLRYAGNAIGSTAASTVEAIPMAIGGAAIGAAVGGPAGAVAGAVGGGLEGQAAKQVAKQALKSTAKNLLTKEAWGTAAAARGAKLGASSSLAQILPASVDQDYLDRGIDNPALAMAVGGLQIPLEFLGEAKALGRIYDVFNSPAGQRALANELTLRTFGKELGSRIVKETAKNAPIEGLTEAAQQSLQDAAAAAVSDSEFFTPEVMSRVANAFAQGVIGSTGLTLGGATAQTIGSLPERKVQVAEEARKLLGEKALEGLDQAEAATVEVSDAGDYVPPTDRVQPTPSVSPTPEAKAALSRKKIKTEKDAVAVEKANAELASKVEKAADVADKAANLEQNIKRKARTTQTKAGVAAISQKSKATSKTPKTEKGAVAKPSPQKQDTVSELTETGKPVSSQTVYAPDEATHVQLNDEFDTSLITRSPKLAKSKLPQLVVTDRVGSGDALGNARFNFDPKTGEASIIEFSPISPKAQEQNAADPGTLAAMDARPFFDNTIKSLAQAGVKSVDLSATNEFVKPKIKQAVDNGLLTPTEKAGVYTVNNAVEIKTQTTPQRFDTSTPVKPNEIEAVTHNPVQEKSRYFDTMRKAQSVIRQIAGDNVAVEFWDSISGVTEDGRMIDLRGYKFKDTIAVGLKINESNGFDPLETSAHEAFHFVYNWLPDSDRALVESERASLQKYTKRHYRKAYNTDLPDIDLNSFDAEEIGALAFGMYAKRRLDGVETSQTGALKVLNKVFNILKKLGNFFAGRGYKTADDVFRNVFNGDYADNGKLSTDTQIKLQQTLVEENKQKIEDRNNRQYYANTEPIDIAGDKSVGKYVDEQVQKLKDVGANSKVAGEYGMMAYVFDLAKSIPGIARTNEVVAGAYRMLRSMFEETRSVLAQFHVDTQNLIANGPYTLIAADAMDFLSDSGQVPTISHTNKTVTYLNKEGKKVVLKGQSYESFVELHRMFKDILEMQDNLLTNDLPDDLMDFREHEKYVNEKGDKATPSELKRLEIRRKLNMMWSSDRVYFPQMRFGDYGIKVTKPGKDGKEEMVGFWMIQSDPFTKPFKGLDTGLVDKKEEARVRQEIEAKYGNMKGHKISGTFRLTNNDVANLFSHNKMAAEEVMSGYMGDAISEQLAEQLGLPYERVKGELSNINAALSNDSAFLDKFEKKIDKMFGPREGFDGYSKDYLRVIDAYFKNYPRAIIQGKHRRAVNKYRVALAGSQVNSKIKDMINKLIDYSTSPQADMALIRQINFFSTLGMNPASAVLQLTTLATSLPATLMQFGSFADVYTTIGRSSVDAGKILNRINDKGLGGLLIGQTSGGERLASFTRTREVLKGLNLTDSEIQLIVDLYAQGDILPVMVQNDMLGELPNANFANKSMYKMRLGGNKLLEVLAGPMATTEQYSRLASALATHRIVTKQDSGVIYDTLKTDQNFMESVRVNQLKGMAEDSAIYMAAVQNSVDNTHAVFGKFARNWNQRGLPGALPFAFMNFPIQAMEYLFHLVKGGLKDDPGKRRAVAYLLASMFMMGGLAGMPAWDLWKTLIEKISYLTTNEKIDLNYEISTMLKESANLPVPVVDAITKGSLSVILNADVGARLSPSFFWQGLATSALKGQMEVTKAMGVQGSLLDNTARRVQQWDAGEVTFPEMLGYSLTPVFIRNAMDALIAWPNDGVRTGKGTMIITPDEVTAGQQALKALGFNPMEVSKGTQAEYAAYIKTHGADQYKSAKTSELANIKYDIWRAGQQGDDKRIDKLRGEYSTKYQDLLEFLRSHGDGQLSARSVDGVKSSIDQKFQAKKNPSKKPSKKDTEALRKARENLGLQ